MLYQVEAAKRYAWFLEHYPGLDPLVNDKYIASFLGVTPVTLSRDAQRAGAQKAQRRQAVTPFRTPPQKARAGRASSKREAALPGLSTWRGRAGLPRRHAFCCSFVSPCGHSAGIFRKW